MPELAPWGWVLLALAAIVVGISKAALPGANLVPVAIFASILPARTSTATLLMLLLVGDVLALIMYRRHADWPLLIRLAPAVLLGMLAGAGFLAFADDAGVRRVIGGILLVMVALTFWLRRRPVPTHDRNHGSRVQSISYGSLGGFTTMVANAGGPVMSLYFLARRIDVKAFLGTAAWFFFIVNVTKLPVSFSLGLVTIPGLIVDAFLVPGVVVGALIGRKIVARMNQAVFDRLIFGLTILAALYLLLR